MKVRFGFVAMAMSLKNASPSQTMTVKSFEAIQDVEAALLKATRIAASNLQNTLRILRHAKASGVNVYRFSSKLIPLFTHEVAKDWDFVDRLGAHFETIGAFVRENGMRVSFHPDHFAVLNTPNSHVLKSSIRDLAYHEAMLQAMHFDERAKLVIHVGGGYKDKEASLNRFVENWPKVPSSIQQRVVIENDDKVFTARDTLTLSERLNIPMVFDVHHDICNHEVPADTGSTEDDDRRWMTTLQRFLRSWTSQEAPPKAHMSSPRDAQNFRAHADNINPAELIPFLDGVREYNMDIDVMLEAKRKDEALFTLMKDLAKYDFIRVESGGAILYRP